MGADKEAEEAEEEETEEETYLPATGQGCYSFHRSLLQRAAQTFSKRSVDDKYVQVAKWLLTGLAVAISRKSWHLLSKHRTCTVTPHWLLQMHFQQGYASDEKDTTKKPYSAAHVGRGLGSPIPCVKQGEVDSRGSGGTLNCGL